MLRPGLLKTRAETGVIKDTGPVRELLPNTGPVRELFPDTARTDTVNGHVLEVDTVNGHVLGLTAESVVIDYIRICWTARVSLEKVSKNVIFATFLPGVAPRIEGYSRFLPFYL